MSPPNRRDLVEEYVQRIRQLKPEDVGRGKTPDDIKKRCLKLCHQFLGGPWSKTNENDIEVRRIYGGLSGQLYRIDLAQHMTLNTDVTVPKQVTIKFYLSRNMKSYYENDTLADMIISTIVSQMGIGPKIYGIFVNGIILRYYEKSAHRLAQIHMLDVPVPKHRHWVLDQMCNCMKYGVNLDDLQSVAKEFGLNNLLEHNLKSEFAWFESYFRHQESSPTVFCHNDFRGGNIMVLPDQSIVVCDFETSSYGPRFVDLGAFLTEWGREWLDFSLMHIPDDVVLQRFCRFYLEGCEQTVPSFLAQSGNSLDEVVHEAKLGLLFNNMFLLAMTINMNNDSPDSVPLETRELVISVEMHYQNYLSIKQSLVDANLI